MADWDLSAVVRRCNTAAAAVPNTIQCPLSFLSSLSISPPPDENQLSFVSDHDHVHSTTTATTSPGFSVDELQAICNPFFPQSTRNAPIKIPIPYFSYSESHHQHLVQKYPQIYNEIHNCSSAFVAGESTSQSASPPLPVQPDPPIVPRKRKKPLKKEVCHVKAEDLTSDKWAWRKYGQKPIKGSLYPRNYYRCSSLSDCLARKQVDRSTTDCTLYILTYRGEHSHPPPTHRNSLYGANRNRIPNNSNAVVMCSSPITTPSVISPEQERTSLSTK